jgi:ankyrin repeat protein
MTRSSRGANSRARLLVGLLLALLLLIVARVLPPSWMRLGRRSGQNAALRRAVWGGELTVLDLRRLLEEGADPNAHWNGYSMLHTAASRENREGVKLLLQAGADPDSLGPDGLSPLIWVVSHGDVETYALLVRSGARVDLAVPRGPTALRRAIEYRRSPMVKRLLADGADPNLQAYNGETPLILAVKQRSLTIVRMLLRAGAGPDAVDYLGNTAADYAISNSPRGSTQEILRALRERGGVRSSQGPPGVRSPARSRRQEESHPPEALRSRPVPSMR